MSTGAWAVVAAVVAVVGTLATVFGGVFTARAGRKASPYEALEKRVLWLEDQHVKSSEKLDVQHAELVRLRAERANDQTEIAGLQRRVAGMFDDRDDLVRYIVILRQWVASGARPPAPAVPEHLADVVPEWVPGDGAEPPRRRD